MSNPQDHRGETACRAVDAAVDTGKLTAAAAQNLHRWLSEPYYIIYRDRLLELTEKSAFSELNSLFWECIPFGTGGRRGPMSEFGSATINARTIAESAHGLAVYVQRAASPHALQKNEGSGLRAVVARDTRHRSMEFARLTASILAAHGFQVFFFPGPRATPMLSFAVRYLRCDTGVMISASHNPPSDNGFKAYWNTGCQVLPPHDAGIIACVDASEDIPSIDFDTAVSEGKIVLLTAPVAGASSPRLPPPVEEAVPFPPTSTMQPPPVDQAYLDAVCALSLSSPSEILALYTPLHGVGASSIFRVLHQAGFHGVELYVPQCSHDGSFPNVPDHLPNPERPQALQPAIDFAKQHGHSLVLASDPDADRLAVAVRTQAEEFVCLSGNQLAALLADFVLSKRAAAGTLSPDHFLVETLVTTPLLETIAHAYGVRAIRDLLVGFKYIAAAIDANGPDKFVFAAEESVGYLAGQYCRDKNASVAALFTLELAGELQLKNQTLIDRLDELYIRFGYYHETQFVQVCPGPQGRDEISRMMRALREKAPGKLGPVVFESARDYQQHQVRSLPSNTFQSQLPQPSGDLLIFAGQSGACRVSLAGRPSGTEPKIKFYLFANCPPELPLTEAKPLAQKCLTELELALKQWLAATVS